MLEITTDRTRIDVDWVHAVLSEQAFWAIGRPRDVVEKSIAGSLCFSAFDGHRQVGFARVVTDEATFAWVCDVFVEEAWRGTGVGRQLMAAIVEDPRLASLKRTILVTDAPGFYRPFGFEVIERPERWMLRPGAGPTD